MTIRRVEDVGPLLRALFVLGSPSNLTDGQLLARFLSGDVQASSLAFESLVERHGPMVLRVCRGVLRDPHDAQDAFQATFLVLVRKARSIRDRDSLASWLHGVALRVATHARANEARRRRLERKLVTLPAVQDKEADDLGPRLHEEVARLPERYRAAVVLCYLEGRTCEDAAQTLRWPVGTVKSRLSRARERLRKRLTRLGLAPAFALGGAPAVVPCPPRLMKQTAEAAARFGARSSAPASASSAVILAEGVLRAMILAKLKIPAIALLLAGSWLGISSALAPGDPIQVPAKAPPMPDKILPASQAPKPDPLTLVAPSGLTARAGSGTAVMYALDSKGDRMFEKQGGPWKEADVELRWVAIVGSLEHKAIQESWAKARGVEVGTFQPEYKRLEIERQVRDVEGWTDWAPLNVIKNYEVLDNLPEIDREEIPQAFRPETLVDPLPFLKKGTWKGVNPERLTWQILSEQMIAERGVQPGPKMGMGLEGNTGKAARKIDPQTLMIRSLDFTVEPGATYRYRVRVVVKNPDLGKGAEAVVRPVRHDANDLRGVMKNPDLGKEKKELAGPWSEATNEATAPPKLPVPNFPIPK